MPLPWSLTLAAPVVLLLAAGLALPAAASDKVPEGKPEGKQEPDKPLDTGTREEVDVVGTPIFEGQKVDGFANPVTSVSQRQIDELNAQDAPSALRRIPGVVISRYNPVGSYGGGEGGGIFIRGHGAGRPGAEITTMIDGIPKFVGVWTHPLLDTMSIDLADRIDVYKGPQPVMTGNMSFGAINFVPRSQHAIGVSHRLRAGYGSFDTASARYERGSRSERYDTFVSASYRRSDGDRTNSEGEVSALYARAGVVLGEHWTLSGMMDLSDGWALDPGVEGATWPEDAPRFDNQDTMTIATLAHSHGPWSGELKLYYDDGDIDWRQWDAGAGEAFFTLTDWENYGFRLSERLALEGGGELVFGIDQDSYGGISREVWDVGTTPLGDFRFQNRSVYAAVNRPLGSEGRLVPSVGIRYNDSRYFGSDWGGEAGLVYRTERGEFYARYAQGYNLPGVWAAIFFQTFYGRGDQWQDLEAEEIDHVEAGFSRRIGDRARLDLAVFTSDVSNGLRFLPPPPFPPAFGNVGDYTSEGAEVSLTVGASEAVHMLLAAAYASTDPEDIPLTPEWTFTAGLSARLAPDWRLHIDAQWVDERLVGNPRFPAPGDLVDSYFLVNGQVAWRPEAWDGKTGVFLAFENLLDEDYSYRAGYPMPGTSFMIGLDWQPGR